LRFLRTCRLPPFRFTADYTSYRSATYLPLLRFLPAFLLLNSPFLYHYAVSVLVYLPFWIHLDSLPPSAVLLYLRCRFLPFCLLRRSAFCTAFLPPAPPYRSALPPFYLHLWVTGFLRTCCLYTWVLPCGFFTTTTACRCHLLQYRADSACAVGFCLPSGFWFSAVSACVAWTPLLYSFCLRMRFTCLPPFCCYTWILRFLPPAATCCSRLRSAPFSAFVLLDGFCTVLVLPAVHTACRSGCTFCHRLLHSAVLPAVPLGSAPV